MRAKDEYAGRKLRCPSCSNVLVIPERPRPRRQEDDVEEVVTLDPVEEKVTARRPRPEAGVTDRPRPKPRLPREDDEDEDDRPRRPRPRRDDEEEDDRPARRRIRQGTGRVDDARPLRRKKPRVVVNEGWFGSINGGVIGGILMMLIAVVWFVLGLAAGYIFFYPPVLFVVGIIAFCKGLMDG
jgi:hypothetical protein